MRHKPMIEHAAGLEIAFSIRDTAESQPIVSPCDGLDFLSYQNFNQDGDPPDVDKNIVADSKPIKFSKRVVSRVLMSSIFHAIRDLPCQLASIDLFNPSKCNINTSANPGGGPNFAINDPSRTRNPINIHPQACDLSPGHLVRRGSFPIQNPSSSRKPGASTHCDEIAQLGIYVPDVGDCFLDCWTRAACAQATRDEKQI